MEEKGFITDIGRQKVVNSSTGEETYLPRYAVWQYDSREGKHQVAECSDDLEYLQRKYNIQEVELLRLY